MTAGSDTEGAAAVSQLRNSHLSLEEKHISISAQLIHIYFEHSLCIQSILDTNTYSLHLTLWMMKCSLLHCRPIKYVSICLQINPNITLGRTTESSHKCFDLCNFYRNSHYVLSYFDHISCNQKFLQIYRQYLHSKQKIGHFSPINSVDRQNFY